MCRRLRAEPGETNPHETGDGKGKKKGEGMRLNGTCIHDQTQGKSGRSWHPGQCPHMGASEPAGTKGKAASRGCCAAKHTKTQNPGW